LEHATSENISEFHIDGEPKKSGVIQIGWRYFDPKEGFRLRIIYAAKEMSSVRLNGVIFGVTNFNDITPPPKGEMSLKSPGFVQLMIAAVLGVGFSILAMVRAVVRMRRPEQQQSQTERLAITGLMVVAVLFQLWAMIAHTTST
jgi:hypothetical protein